jgi:hypothetical protein
MKKRAYSLTSLLLGLIAWSLCVAGQKQDERGLSLVKQAIDTAVAMHQTNNAAVTNGLVVSFSGPPADPRWRLYVRQSQILDRIGVIFGLSCVAFFIAAYRKREPGWYFVPVVIIVVTTIGAFLL